MFYEIFVSGPLFWAYEYGFAEGISILEQIGVSRYTMDGDGKTAMQMAFIKPNTDHMARDNYASDEDSVEENDDYEF